MEAASFDGFRALLLLVETHVGKWRSDRLHHFHEAPLAADKGPLLRQYNDDDHECAGCRCRRYCYLLEDSGLHPVLVEARRDPPSAQMSQIAKTAVALSNHSLELASYNVADSIWCSNLGIRNKAKTGATMYHIEKSVWTTGMSSSFLGS